MDFRVIGERSDLRFDGGKNPRDLFDWTSPIIRREDPKGYGGYGKFAAPLEYIVELVCAQRIGFGRGAKVIFLTVPPVSVKDDADVTRDWMPSDLAFQPTLISSIRRVEYPRDPAQPLPTDQHRAPQNLWWLKSINACPKAGSITRTSPMGGRLPTALYNHP
jgi:hypothetical protein